MAAPIYVLAVWCISDKPCRLYRRLASSRILASSIACTGRHVSAAERSLHKLAGSACADSNVSRRGQVANRYRVLVDWVRHALEARDARRGADHSSSSTGRAAAARGQHTAARAACRLPSTTSTC